MSRRSSESRRALVYREGKIRETLKREGLAEAKILGIGGWSALALLGVRGSSLLSVLLPLLNFFIDGGGRGRGGLAVKDEAKNALVFDGAGGEAAELYMEKLTTASVSVVVSDDDGKGVVVDVVEGNGGKMEKPRAKTP